MSDRDIVGSLTNEPSITGEFTPDLIIKGSMEARFPANVYVVSPLLLDRTGGNYTLSIDISEIIANLPPSGVASVFARTGDVTAQSGDYTFAQIGSKPTTINGYGITDGVTLAGSEVLTNKNLTSGTNTFPTFNQNTAGSAAKLTTARNIDGQAFDGTANITVIAPGTHAATGKTTPVDADELPLVDTAASNVLKKLTWANLKATLAAWLVSAGWIRERLTANRTYYFRSDGNDSNTGLTNSSGGAFLTIQKAIDTVAALDCSIYDVSIVGGSGGTFSPFVLKSFVGSGKVTITGDTTTPTNYVLSSTSADGVSGSNVLGRYKIEGFKFTNATSGSHIKLYNTYCEVGANDYGAATTAHIWLEQNAYVEVNANYTISGGASRHLFATTGGVFVCSAKTVTLTGTPAFSSATIIASRTGVFNLPGNTYSGAATGTRYIISFNAVADVAGGGASYIPGNAAGVATTGGQYA